MKKIFLLALPFVLFSCSSDSDDVVVPSGSDNSNALTYIRGIANGQAIDYSYILNSPSSPSAYGYGNGYSSDGFTKWFYYGGEFAPASSLDGTPRIDLGWNNMVVGTETEESAAFAPAFTTVPVTYLTSAQNDNHEKGVDIEYESETGATYSTMAGSQAGSTFTISSSVAGIEDGGTLHTQTIIGTYSCKLYNWDNPTDIISITNGTYKVILREFD